MELSLNGEWTLCWNNGCKGEPLARLHEAEPELRCSLTAQVPGEVHLDLMKAGIIDDPLPGSNCLKARWVEESFWYYRKSFDAPALAAGERAWLVFDQLDIAAVVYLNGDEIARHCNSFYPLRIEISGKLKAGRNILVVSLEGGLFANSDRPTEGYAGTPSWKLTKRYWLRAPQSQFGWDWAERLTNIGITGGVRIETFRDVRPESCVVLAELSPDLKKGIVTSRVFVEGFGDQPRAARLAVEVVGAGRRIEEDVTIAAGLNPVEARLAFDNPELWWPVGHGKPALYTVRVTLTLDGRTIAEYSRKVGFRHVRVNQDPHPQIGNYFIIEVNRKPIFCKGGNFVPADPIFARIDRKRYEALVDLALEANFNFLRVWGGGLYESDDFYELCDERGIMVWQEFIFACAKYPATDERFLADVKREAIYQVRRLAHHASLVIWCGNNELEWHNVWEDDKGVTSPDYALFHYVLPRLLKEEDRTRYYHPSSPWSAGSDHPNADHKGDQHPWDVTFKHNDWREYRKMICRFPNEGGVLGPTALPTIKACLEPGQAKPWSFSWQVHENEATFQLPTDEMFKQWLGLDIRQIGLEDYAYYGGLLQGMALAEYVKNFRRRMFDSASAIFWMYNDCWPMVRSWTIVDYYLRRTPSFHPVRRAFAPLTVVLAAEEGKVKVFGVNEGPAAEVEVRYGLCALAGGYPFDKTRKIRLRANAATLVAAFDQSKWEKLGEKDHAAFAILKRDGAEMARDILLLPLYKEMSWPRPEISVKREKGRAIFRSDAFAFRVCLDLDGTNTLPDNFFDLLPGEPYVLPWPESLGKPEVKRVWLPLE